MSTTAKILVAEDDVNGAHYLSQSLNRLGYSVTDVVHAGEDVIGNVAREQPDLILMDVTLNGEIDGIRAAEILHVDYDIPIIYLTAHTDNEVFQRAQITVPHGYLVKPFDITHLQHAIEIALSKHGYEKWLKESESRYRTIFEVSGSAMMIINELGATTMVNGEFQRLTGYSREDAESGKNWSEFFQDEDRAAIADLQQQACQQGGTGDHRPELRLRVRDGGTRIVTIDIRPVPASSTMIVSMNDITGLKRAEKEIGQLNDELSKINADLMQEIAERKKVEKQLKHQADHDPLTGLPNRVLLFDRLKQAFAFDDRHNSLLALMMLDLDNFKSINDTMGHLSGDILLKKVAKRLQQCMRQYDTVGRIGGDEFVIVANDIQNIHDIIKFAEKVKGLFEQPFEIIGQQVYATTSIGVAVYPIHGTSVKMLMSKADAAMYTAKNSGKNAYCFYSSAMDMKEPEHSQMRARRRTVNQGPETGDQGPGKPLESGAGDQGPGTGKTYGDL
ncbi:diguanylate cyclase domain-containing protein [Geobacter sp. SVR]|uniref:diguanylate cyclase domain-containing protein n=1 Tax=Geobacter sp. SVR TaxID=2495594 RepID=UPI00143F03E2|nr:diguanylate cyclase [Geobacter sp. SVR]BCS54991.1 hypothetical protein GSVR_32990 [Geobacter sp. SVR]GCF85173.1 hypothetical protein GSbR_17730 [Geobacter sp. SVR]